MNAARYFSGKYLSLYIYKTTNDTSDTNDKPLFMRVLAVISAIFYPRQPVTNAKLHLQLEDHLYPKVREVAQYADKTAFEPRPG